MSDIALTMQVINTLQQQLHWLNALSLPEQITLLTLYLLTSLIFAFVLWHLMPRHYHREGLWGFILLLSFNVFIPLFGILGSCLFTFYLHRLIKHEKSDPMVTVTHMSFDTKFHSSVHRSYGEGGAHARLYDTKVPGQGRVTALLALTAVKGPGANAILQETLLDDLDELRLLAFGLIDDQEKRIYAIIHRMQHVLNTMELSQDIRALIQKGLASFHWELCYLELVQGDMRDNMLEKSQAYAEQALQVMTTDSRLWVLLGRNYMSRNLLDKAHDAFNKAIERDAATSKALPYLAELYFKTRDYDALKKVLRQCQNLRDIPALGSVIDFWGAA